MRFRSRIMMYCIITFGLLPFFASGQPGDPNGGGAPGSVPISGIEWLLAAGMLWGIRNLIKKDRGKQ